MNPKTILRVPSNCGVVSETDRVETFSCIPIVNIGANMRGLRVSGRVVKKAEPREISTRYGTAIIADAELEDTSGRIQWRLWRDQVNLVSIGDMVVIENAFVRSVGGSLELNLGADGKISISKEQMPRTATEVR